MSDEEIDQLWQAMKIVAPVAADLDVSVEQLAAVLIQLLNGGQEAMIEKTDQQAKEKAQAATGGRYP